MDVGICSEKFLPRRSPLPHTFQRWNIPSIRGVGVKKLEQLD